MSTKRMTTEEKLRAEFERVLRTHNKESFASNSCILRMFDIAMYRVNLKKAEQELRTKETQS